MKTSGKVPGCAPMCISGGGDARANLSTWNAQEVTRIPHNHTYGSHLHIRRRKPEANRVLHFYSALSFFSLPRGYRFPRLVARSRWTNEHTISHPCHTAALSLCSSPVPPPALLLETVFHIQNVPRASRSPTRFTDPLLFDQPPRIRDSWASVLVYLWKEYKT